MLSYQLQQAFASLNEEFKKKKKKIKQNLLLHLETFVCPYFSYLVGMV
jgi:hypothetical protein